MIHVAAVTMIDRPVQDVWDFFTDLSNSPQWTRSGSELRVTSPGPLGIGTTIASVRTIFGREIKSQRIIVTGFEPPNRLSIEAHVPLLGRATNNLEFRSMGVGTSLSREGDLSLGRAEPVLGPMLARLISSQWNAELANVKRLVEGPTTR